MAPVPHVTDAELAEWERLCREVLAADNLYDLSVVLDRQHGSSRMAMLRLIEEVRRLDRLVALHHDIVRVKRIKLGKLCPMATSISSTFSACLVWCLW